MRKRREERSKNEGKKEVGGTEEWRKGGKEDGRKKGRSLDGWTRVSSKLLYHFKVIPL